MIRICGRDLRNVKQSDRLLASSWFVPGVWKYYDYTNSVNWGFRFEVQGEAKVG